MADEEERITKAWKEHPAKKPSKREELVEKATKHIMKKAEEANGQPLDLRDE